MTGSYGAGTLSFADSHAEAHKWLEPCARPAWVKVLMLWRLGLQQRHARFL